MHVDNTTRRRSVARAVSLMIFAANCTTPAHHYNLSTRIGHCQTETFLDERNTQVDMRMAVAGCSVGVQCDLLVKVVEGHCRSSVHSDLYHF